MLAYILCFKWSTLVANTSNFDGSGNIMICLMLFSNIEKHGTSYGSYQAISNRG